MLPNHDECCGCHACYSICPMNSIRMAKDKLGFLYPQIIEETCIKCGKCENVCPVMNPVYEKTSEPYAFGGHAKDSEIRAHSSSGGVFHLLAVKVIESGGVVFGAALSNDYRSVHHIMVQDIEGLSLLYGSKYVQSNINDSLIQVKNELLKKRRVLFSGTPCQIDGLNRYINKVLKKELINYLITVEVICHGAPSPRIFENYIDTMASSLGSPITGVYFRDEVGGRNLMMRIVTEKGDVYKKSQIEDNYYRLFLSDTCHRESCYKCPSRGLNKRADITISDFWGVENVSKDLIDGGGLSLIMIHSHKGSILFNEIKDELSGHEVSFLDSIKGNPAFFVSYRRPKLRNEIENDIESFSMNELVEKYTVTTKDKIISFLDKIHLYEPLRRIRRKFTKE